MVKKMMGIYADEPAWLIYSMWGGYADAGKPYSVKEVIELRQLFGNHIADGTRDGFHTSGHADIDTLLDVCRSTMPKIGVVPIHKDCDAVFSDLSDGGLFRVFSSGENTVDNVKITINEDTSYF